MVFQRVWQLEGKLWHWMVIYRTWRYSRCGTVLGHGIEDEEAEAREAAFVIAERFCLNNAP